MMQNADPIQSLTAPIWNGITLESMIKFCVIYFFVIWVGLIIWVARDISYRSESRIYQVICILIMVVFTPLGVLLYLLIRPRKVLYEKCAAEIEGNLEILSSIVSERISDQELQDNSLACPECESEIESDFIICPSCKYSLKDTCHECHKVIRQSWKVCPYCQTKQKKKKKK